MKENTSSPEDPKELESSDSSQANQQDNIQAKLEKCDTLLDLLEEDGTPGVSSKETTSESTAYPEFGNANSTKNSSGTISLQIKICTTEIPDSNAQQLVAGTILTSHESVEQTVEILWKGQVVGTGYLYAHDNYYVIKIAELSDLTESTQRGFAYEI